MAGLNIAFKISAIDDFSKTMSNLEKHTKKAFDSVGQIGAAMTAAGVATAAGLGLAVKTTADFESAMSRVGALSGATDSELSKLTDTAKQLGESTAFSASEAAQGMQFLAMAGYKTNEIIDAMPGLLNAAAAGQIDLARTADITSNILSGFGLEASETARVADVLTKTFTSSNTDLSMLGDTMKYVAPVAKAAGQSLEEMAAATGLLGNAGIQGSQAGTALRMALIRLADPPKEAAGALEDLGVKVTDSQGNMKSLSQIIEDLTIATKDMGEADRLAAISKITGVEAASAFIALMDAGADELRAFTKELQNSGGTAQNIANKQLDNLNGQLTLLKSALEGAMISIGTALLPAIKAFVSGLQWLVDAFNALPAPIKSFIAITGAVVAVLGLVLGPILILIGVLPSLIGGFTMVAGALGITAGALATIIGIVSAVIVGIIALGAAFVIAYNKVDWFREFVNNAWNQIKAYFQTALTFIQGVVNTVMTAISSFISEKLSQIQAFWNENGAMIMQATQNVWNVIKTIINGVMTAINAIMKALWPVIKVLVISTWDAIKGAISAAIDVILGVIQFFSALFTGNWSALWDAIKRIVKGTAELIWNLISLVFVGKIMGTLKLFASGAKALITALWNGIKAIFTFTLNAIKTVVVSYFNLIKSTITISMNGVKAVISSVWNTIKTVFNTVIGTIKTVVSNGFTAMKNAIHNLMNNIRSKIREIWNKVEQFFRNIDLYEIGRNIIQGLINGITSMVGSLMSKALDIVNSVKNTIKNALNINSPSRVMIEIGGFVGEGLALGMADTIPDIEKSSLKLSQAVVPEFTRTEPIQSTNREKSGNVNVSINVHGEVIDELAFQRFVRKISEELGAQTGGTF
jgi:TP901 family phage tail tape measure protein